MMPLQKYDRFPPSGLQLGVDPVCFRAHFFQEILVALDVRSARRADLHETESPLVRRIQLQESLDCPEPLQNSFRVIHAVHSYAKQRSLNSQFFAERRALRSRTWHFVRVMSVLRKRHADRIWPYPRNMPLSVHGE